MMTARAENRLHLRADNAVSRLGASALAASCVGTVRAHEINEHLARRQTREWQESQEGQADALYAPYVDRQQRAWDAVNRDLDVAIPARFDFGSVPGMSSEMVERLNAASPDNLDQARRVPGVTPAALSALHVAIHKQRLAA